MNEVIWWCFVKMNVVSKNNYFLFFVEKRCRNSKLKWSKRYKNLSFSSVLEPLRTKSSGACTFFFCWNYACFEKWVGILGALIYLLIASFFCWLYSMMTESFCSLCFVKWHTLFTDVRFRPSKKMANYFSSSFKYLT